MDVKAEIKKLIAEKQARIKACTTATMSKQGVQWCRWVYRQEIRRLRLTLRDIDQ